MKREKIINRQRHEITVIRVKAANNYIGLKGNIMKLTTNLIKKVGNLRDFS